jgi:hypothetical protein
MLCPFGRNVLARSANRARNLSRYSRHRSQVNLLIKCAWHLLFAQARSDSGED